MVRPLSMYLYICNSAYYYIVQHVTEYDPKIGAKGYEVTPGLSGTLVNPSTRKEVIWPPYALELELRERKWQVLAAAESSVALTLLFFDSF